MGLCYKAQFGCSTAKAVAVALADHADDDGQRVYPSVKRLSEKCEVSTRTVQRALRLLESMGVIRIISAGGAGPRNTREWSFDLALIQQVVNGTAVFAQPAKGDTETPLDDELRVTPVTLRVTPMTPKGDTGVTRTSNNLQETPTAPLPPEQAEAPISGQVISNGLKRRALPLMRIAPGTASWNAWIDHIDQKLGSHQRERAEICGELFVTSRFPDDTTPMPVIGRSA